MDDESSRYDKLVSMLQDGSPEPRNLPLEYLRNITDNFSDDRLLGEGGFGTVYKVHLQKLPLAHRNWASGVERPHSTKYFFSTEKEYQSRKRSIEIDLPTSPASSTDSVDSINRIRFGDSGDVGGDVQLLCQSLGLSGPDDFAVPIAEWEAHKALRSTGSACSSPSSVLPNSNTKAPARETPLRYEEPSRPELLPKVRDDPIEAPERPASLNRPELTWPDQKEAINGVRPQPLLKPPPTIALPVVCWEGSTWDILRSFAPDDENEEQHAPASRSGLDAVEEEDEENASTTTVFSVSPKGTVRKKIQSWIRGTLLGSGSFGTVYEGISDDGDFFAVKEVSLYDQGSNAKQCIFQLEQEIALLSQFEHENIVQYYGTDKEDSKLYIFLELVTQGSLASLYQKYRLHDTHVSAYTRQILNGLTYLHERNIVHRDIKCGNILVHANGSVKLADFGLAKEITKFSAIRSCKGTVYWMAPEVVNPKKIYGTAADIWSLGCTVLEMLTRQIPYPDLEWTRALYTIGKGEAPPIPNSLSKDAYDFISQCVKANAEDRPSASNLLEHPFVKRSITPIRSMRTSRHPNSSTHGIN
nr:unnamed protein product [Digitaria exilis]